MSLLDRIRSWFGGGPERDRIMDRPYRDEKYDDPRAPDTAEAPTPLAEDVRPPTEQQG